MLPTSHEIAVFVYLFTGAEHCYDVTSLIVLSVIGAVGAVDVVTSQYWRLL